MAESDFQNIEVCVFDAYGTLFDVHSPTAKAATSMGGKAGAVSELWRRKQLEYTWLRSLMPAYADFWQVTGDGLDYALEAHGIDDEALRAVVAAVDEQDPGRGRPGRPRGSPPRASRERCRRHGAGGATRSAASPGSPPSPG